MNSDSPAGQRKTEALWRVAGELRERAAAIRAAVAARRRGRLSFRDQMAVWEETRRTLRDIEETAGELAAERGEAEREAAEQAAWVRGQVESMLDAGWNRYELADVGIGDEVLAQTGLLDDPRLRGEPEAL